MEENKRKPWILLIGLAVVLLAATLLYRALSGSDEPLPEPSEEELAASESELSYAENFTMLNEDGEEVELADFIGRPIVMNFWASWCPPCKKELPDFEKMYQAYGSEVVFLMVNLTDGQRETVDIAKSYLAENGFDFPVYFDTRGDALQKYGIMSIPMTVSVDREGRVRFMSVGMLDESGVKKAVNFALS